VGCDDLAVQRSPTLIIVIESIHPQVVWCSILVRNLLACLEPVVGVVVCFLRLKLVEVPKRSLILLAHPVLVVLRSRVQVEGTSEWIWQQVLHAKHGLLTLLLYVVISLAVGGLVLIIRRWPIGAVFPMVAKLATLSEREWTRAADEGLLTRVRVLVLLLVLGQAERLRTKATLDFFFRIVLLVMPLQWEFGLERSFTLVDVAFEDWNLLHLGVSTSFFVAVTLVFGRDDLRRPENWLLEGTLLDSYLECHLDVVG